MHVLVTGGAGYIGSVTAQMLLESGHRVTVLDDLSRGHRDLVPDEAAFVAGDSGDADLVDSLAEGGLDACVHFAAFIDVEESVRHPDLYLDNNARKTERLIDVLLAHGVERFVFSSTAAVYGIPERVPIPVSHPRRPANPYGVSKVEVEDALARRAPKLRHCILRYFNAAGATAERGEDHPNETHLIPRVLDVALGRRDAVDVFGSGWDTRDGTCVRDYIHVADLAEAHVKALAAVDRKADIVCNVGTGRGHTVMEVIEACRAVTGEAIPVRPAEPRAGDVPELVADPSDAVRELGWEPRHPDITDIVASAWGWHRRRMSGRGDAPSAGLPLQG